MVKNIIGVSQAKNRISEPKSIQKSDFCP